MSDPWAGRLIDAQVRRELGDQPDLGALLEAYYPWQVERWPRLRDSLALLDGVLVRDIPLGERPLRLQYNPGREASATAKVADHEIRARPCFLCPHHLPPEEVGLPFGEQLIWLANPAPVVPLHFTIVHREHRRQELLPVLSEALEMARGTAGRLEIFYNGPRSGASAPDHLHLQGIASGRLPDVAWVGSRLTRGEMPGCLLGARPGLQAYANRDADRLLLVFHGEPRAVEHGLRLALDVQEELGRYDGWEPPLNLVLTSDGESVTALLYPRGAHRPACFFAEDPDRRIVSPGAVDVAGLAITPRRSDFEALDVAAMQAIFSECSLALALAAELEFLLHRRLKHG